MAKKEFGIFETMLLEEIRKNWSLKFGRTGVDQLAWGFHGMRECQQEILEQVFTKECV